MKALATMSTDTGRRLVVALALLLGGSVTADEDAERTRLFDTSTLKGACGIEHLESAAAHGANTIRTWTVNEDGSSTNLLDDAHRLRLRVILGVWMPPAPKDAPRYRLKPEWKYDYAKNRAVWVGKMRKFLDLYDSHPAVLMWCLGNEVELSPEYLKTVNEMSELVHKHNSSRLTCIAALNAPSRGIKMIKQYAPDLDLYGANSFGRGAIHNVCRRLETEWGKKYFFTEFTYRGPWTARKTASDSAGLSRVSPRINT